MSDVKWIKIVTDVFDNRKIRQIEKMPEGDAIVVVWFKLLCLAGEVNDGGMLYLTKEVPYTPEMLSTHFGRPLQIINLALHTFEAFGMIEIIENVLFISNWEKYQNGDALEKIREQTRARVASHRQKRLLESPCNVTVTLPVTQCNATDIEIDKEYIEDTNVSSCPEPVTGSEPPAILLPLNTGEEYPVTKKLAEELGGLYPAVDVMQQLRSMRGWLLSNPQNRKTKRGITRFINSWLSREQNRAPCTAKGKTSYDDVI